jgi:hypothetical protein
MLSSILNIRENLFFRFISDSMHLKNKFSFILKTRCSNAILIFFCFLKEHDPFKKLSIMYYFFCINDDQRLKKMKTTNNQKRDRNLKQVNC